MFAARRLRKALQHLEHKLGIHGRNHADGMFTLQQCECLGACADAPVMLVNDRTCAVSWTTTSSTSWSMACVLRRAGMQ
jgi:NADH:ubiquinone oxidoreductase subunit E